MVTDVLVFAFTADLLVMKFCVYGFPIFCFSVRVQVASVTG